jgi:beta-lactamase class A
MSIGRAGAVLALSLTLAGCRPVPTSGTSAEPAAAPSVPSEGSPSTLAQVLDRALARFQATTGVYVKHLKTGEEAGVRADQDFNSFSVIKLAIMVKAYQMADRHELDLDQRVDVGPDDIRDGSGMLYMFDPGLRVTLRDLITQMVITSDNTATDMLLARVGGLDALNAWLRDTGFARTRMVQTLSDFFRQPLIARDARYASLSNRQVFAYWFHPLMISTPLAEAMAPDGARLQKEAPPSEVVPAILPRWSTDPEYWLGSMTPRETARLLEGIETGSLASAQSSEQMKRIMLWQREGALRLQHYLTYPVAHKTGDGPTVIANDVGMVYTPGGTILISFFSASNTAPYAEHEDRIGVLAREVVAYFDEKAPAQATAPAATTH